MRWAAQTGAAKRARLSHKPCVWQDETRANLITATAASSLVSTFIMGAFANMPVGLAPGLGVNAYFAYNVVRPVSHVLPGEDHGFQVRFRKLLCGCLIAVMTTCSNLPCRAPAFRSSATAAGGLPWLGKHELWRSPGSRIR